MVVSRMRSLLDGCGFVFISDLSASRAADWLAGLRRQARPRVDLPPDQEWFTLREAAAVSEARVLDLVDNPKCRRAPGIVLGTEQSQLQHQSCPGRQRNQRPQ